MEAITIDKSAGPLGCWIWQGNVAPVGYGRSKGQYIHRLTMERRLGRALTSQESVLHHCDTPLCVNHRHLFLGSQRDNMRDAVSKHRIPAGETHYASKLTAEQVREARLRWQPRSSSNSGRALAREYGVSHTTMSHILRGESWRSVR